MKYQEFRSQVSDAASLCKSLLTFRKNTLLSIAQHSPSKGTSHPRTLEPARTLLFVNASGLVPEAHTTIYILCLCSVIDVTASEGTGLFNTDNCNEHN